jgi:hypothetical protein
MAKTKHKNKKKNILSNKSHSSLAKLRFSHPFILIALAIITLLTAANIQTTQNFTANAQNVLGEDEQGEEQKQAEEQQKEAEKQAEEAQEESAKQAEEQQKEAEKTTINTTEASELPRTSIKSKIETISPNGLKMKTESEDEKQETEIETADGQKIKTKIEDDGTTKIEIENGTVKLKYSIVNGQVALNVENEDGEEVEIKDDELEELENAVEDELEDDDIRLVPTTDNQLVLAQNQIAALTNFPLSIDVVTKELIITTPAGQKVVTVLPDDVVQNLFATGIINSIEIPPSDIATQDQLGTLTGVVEIETRDNEIVYKIKGKKIHRVLGIIPVTTPVTAFVSTDTGLTVAKQQSILTNVIDFLSP